MTTFLITFADGTTDKVQRPELYTMIRTFLRDLRRFNGEALDKATLTGMSLAETSAFVAITLLPRQVHWTARILHSAS